MSHFDQIKLEIVRPGPSNNQLLSPLTQYLALCGESAPTTFSIDLEHHELLNKLTRLRYYAGNNSAGGVAAIPDSIRESTISELGKDMARILDRLKPLLVEQWRVLGASETRQSRNHDQQQAEKMYAHVRLVASGSELSILPFELAMAPAASPGEGREWLLDSRLPLVLTREVRRSVALAESWNLNNKPRVLVIIAEPGGSDVPKSEHVKAITRAIRHWVPWPDNEIELTDNRELKEKRLSLFEDRIHILRQASIQEIQSMCIEHDYTHVHILAHGDKYQHSLDERFGVALCDQNDPSKIDTVSGERLAAALTSQGRGARRTPIPKFVCLAICDSGNTGTVYAPGGSIAHDIHLAGVPWVIASQFPLTKSGSVYMTKTLYEGIFRGDDPRVVLHDIRRDLMINTSRNHDWASIIAYASFNRTFDSEVHDSYQFQSRGRIETSLRRIDNLELAPEKVVKNEDAAAKIRDQAFAEAEKTLSEWSKRLPHQSDSSMEARIRRCEYHGMCGSKCKREALMKLAHLGLIENIKSRTKNATRLRKEARNLLNQALQHYRDGIDERAYEGSKFHWVATQALSLLAILKGGADPLLYSMTRQHAEQDLKSAAGTDKAWAHGTLAELVLLKSYHEQTDTGKSTQKSINTATVNPNETRYHCAEMVEICTTDKFPIESTLRQFKRYAAYEIWKNPIWDDAVTAAIAELEAGSTETNDG
ncbi:hypothetical protein AB833_15000 [Chromatiales bacterium (ex Bugula neritina AB1)]|nr:hypothetical protein AB833_15000 [Chromatiales bacterium (ex Bugula neritina AB1)]